MNIPVAAWGLYSNKVSTLWRIKRSANGRYSTPVATVVESTKMTIEEAEKLFKEIY